MILGTAGHIDHGKSQLIRTLTGVDTDRLAEEKKRGISIELGYAYAEWQGQRIGFIDVPGHEKLIHTMVAGASGMQGVLLVIAVDDGIMPQTREHLAILSLLAIPELIVVFTKIDLVEQVYPSALEEDVRALCAQYALPIRAFFALDARHPEDLGLQNLRAHLTQWLLSSAPDTTVLDRTFRMPIDRVFTLTGQGTVVTGTVDSGAITVEDHLQLLPLQQSVRVRQIHAQNQAASSAQPGQRCAVNLVGVEKDHIERGHVLADASGVSLSARFDIEYQPLVAWDGTQQTWQSVHIHIATYHTTGHLVPLAPIDEANRAGRWWVQVVLGSAIPVRMGDRCIIRNAQASQTIGGGVIVHPEGLSRKRKTPERLALLAGMRIWIHTQQMAAWLAASPLGLSGRDLQAYTGIPFAHWSLESSTLASTESVRILTQREEVHWITETHWQHLWKTVQEKLSLFHQKYPLEPGVTSERLRRICFPHWSFGTAVLWGHLIRYGMDSGQIVQQKAWISLPSHVVRLAIPDQALADQIVLEVMRSGISGIWVREVAESLQIEESDVRRIVQFLARQGDLVQIVPDLVALFEQTTHWIAAAKAVLDAQSQFTVIAFKEQTQLGRKRAIQILEFLDRTGYTRRTKEKRSLR